MPLEGVTYTIKFPFTVFLFINIKRDVLKVECRLMNDHYTSNVDRAGEV